MSDDEAIREEIRTTFMRNGFRDICESMGRDDALWCIMNAYRAVAPEFVGEDADERKARWQKGYDERMKEFEKRQTQTPTTIDHAYT